MQQLLQGQQVQAKVLNQVTTEIDTRMGNMFTELNNKYDNHAIHMRKIDVQLAQTAESVKRQQEMLPGRTDKNPRTEHCNAVEQPFAETILVAEENTEQSASFEVIAPSEPAETPPVRVYVPKVPYPIPPRHLMDPISEEQLIGFNKMVRRLPKELAFEDALQIQKLKAVPEKEHGDKEQGWRTRMVAKSEPPVALRTIMYYLLLRHITISVFKKKNEINVMEKGKKEKKHGATGKVEQEVWSCIGWEMNQLEQKRQKTRSNPSDCSEEVFQRQRFLRKQQPISGFALISLFSLPAACGLDISSFSIFPYHTTLEKAISLDLEKNPLNPITLFQSYFMVFCEHIGLDLYCLLSHLDPNESLGIKIDQHREQYHDSGLFYLSDPSSRLALN
ncbi:hypothetical protein IGI04_018117 [Brassica rapa subsp. trilocularis]|uniref:Uncharacterized protein n=1 Tax=Brassica rapa subsp. trilocularis TaxID=1813537 RepID=A0ABQ7MC07_BRACM|nr:hypothetical protein IGI04_018117 [Brassica rapa subsp. trilocularis]